ncbi:MAG: hypothetical protein IJT35_01945 [Paludibacteraceae bacterium]|nr:hypothetical protein [Paludibacteraceae bacterium]
MRKIFILALTTVVFLACNKSNDQMGDDKMVNGLVDYHAHAITDSYRELVAKHGMLFDEGFPLPQWSVESQLQMMAEAGIDRAILTLPAPHPYFGDQAECNAACRQFNEELADLVESQKSKAHLLSPPRSLCRTYKPLSPKPTTRWTHSTQWVYV